MAFKRILLSMITAMTILFSFAQSKSLDYYIEQALLNSPLIRDYKNQVQMNQLDSQRIRAVYRPQVNGSSVNYYAPSFNGYGYDKAVTNGAQVSGLIGVNLQVISRENLNSQLTSIQLQNEALANNTKITEQELKRTISAQYIATYSDLQQMQFFREIISRLQKEEQVLKQLTEKNVYRQSEYLNFVVTLKQQQLSYQQFSLQFKNNFALLNYLSGITDTSSATLQDPGILMNTLPDPSVSVFFQQFRTDSLKLANSHDSIRFAYKPKLNVFADGGYLSSMYYLPYKNFGVSAGFSIIVPIYDGHQRKIKYNQLTIAEQTRIGYKDFFRRQYDQQLSQLIQQLNGTIDLQKDINTQVTYAEGLIRVNARLLETGDVRIADYIIALNSYLNARYLFTQNNISRLQIINQINYWNR